MAFELIVAAKRDPVAAAELLQRQEPPTRATEPAVTTIDVSGVFGEGSSEELAERVADALRGSSGNVIVRFQEMACEDVRSLARFAAWIAALRQAGHEVRIVAKDPQLHALLARETVASDAVILAADADAAAGRSSIEGSGGAAPSPRVNPFSSDPQPGE